MLTMIGGWLAKSALMQSPIGGLVKGMPRRAWIALACVALLAGGYLYHQHKAHAAIAAARAGQKAADEADFAKRVAAVAAQAQQLRIAAEQLQAKISTKVRTDNDQMDRDIAARAAGQRVQGPGAAASHCRPLDHPGLPGPGGGPVAAGRGGDAAGPSMPAGDGATVPWSWLVGRAEEHDTDRAEVLSWREWYAEQAAAWEKMRAQPAAH